jgi:group I intron endonuclease
MFLNLVHSEFCCIFVVMKTSGIYQIKNKVNGKSYIGSSVRLNKRWKRHLTDLKCNVHHSLALQRAFHKYGSDNFEFSILENCDENLLLEREQFYLDSLKPEYNICSVAGNCLGIKQSEETIEKRKISNSKYWDSVGRKHKDKLKITREQNALVKKQKEQRNLQILEELKSGIRQDIIAEKYNLSPSVITQLKKKYNIVTDIIAKGSNNGFAKLTEEQVKEIKYLLKDKVKQQTIADKYNVKLRTIKAIQSGQNWNHIKIKE